MIIVTGGAGFIGSNIIKSLNEMGYRDILVVDNLKDGTKFVNLVDLDIADYCDKEDFIASIVAGDDLGDIDAIFHEGACSSTTEWDGKYMMDTTISIRKITLISVSIVAFLSCTPLPLRPTAARAPALLKNVSTSNR